MTTTQCNRALTEDDLNNVSQQYTQLSDDRERNQRRIRELHTDGYDDTDDYEETITSKIATNSVAFKKMTNFSEVDLRDIYSCVQGMLFLRHCSYLYHNLLWFVHFYSHCRCI